MANRVELLELIYSSNQDLPNVINNNLCAEAARIKQKGIDFNLGDCQIEIVPRKDWGDLDRDEQISCDVIFTSNANKNESITVDWELPIYLWVDPLDNRDYFSPQEIAHCTNIVAKYGRSTQKTYIAEAMKTTDRDTEIRSSLLSYRNMARYILGIETGLPDHAVYVRENFMGDGALYDSIAFMSYDELKASQEEAAKVVASWIVLDPESLEPDTSDNLEKQLRRHVSATMRILLESPTVANLQKHTIACMDLLQI